MILALLAAAARRAKCLLGLHDLFTWDTKFIVENGTEIRFHSRRACRVAACQAQWRADRPNEWKRTR